MEKEEEILKKFMPVLHSLWKARVDSLHGQPETDNGIFSVEYRMIFRSFSGSDNLVRNRNREGFAGDENEKKL